MKIAIIGADGQVEYDLLEMGRGHELVPLTHAQIEITDLSSVQHILTTIKPDVVINTATKLKILPITTSSLGTTAVRPSYSVLGHGKPGQLGMDDLSLWEDALERYFFQRRIYQASHRARYNDVDSRSGESGATEKFVHGG